jgi:hypothetical protein
VGPGSDSSRIQFRSSPGSPGNNENVAVRFEDRTIEVACFVLCCSLSHIDVAAVAGFSLANVLYCVLFFELTITKSLIVCVASVYRQIGGSMIGIFSCLLVH